MKVSSLIRVGHRGYSMKCNSQKKNNLKMQKMNTLYMTVWDSTGITIFPIVLINIPHVDVANYLNIVWKRKALNLCAYFFSISTSLSTGNSSLKLPYLLLRFPWKMLNGFSGWVQYTLLCTHFVLVRLFQWKSKLNTMLRLQKFT